MYLLTYILYFGMICKKRGVFMKILHVNQQDKKKEEKKSTVVEPMGCGKCHWSKQRE